jgi:hypothetical protein
LKIKISLTTNQKSKIKVTTQPLRFEGIESHEVAKFDSPTQRVGTAIQLFFKALKGRNNCVALSGLGFNFQRAPNALRWAFE